MKLLASLVIAAVFALGAPACQPAEAATWAWSDTSCFAGYPVYGAWYGWPLHGADYASVYAAPGYGSVVWRGQLMNYQRVNYGIHAYYRDLGYECGWAGLPISKVYMVKEGYDVRLHYVFQYFHRPGTCDLRWLVVRNDGARGVGSQRHFC